VARVNKAVRYEIVLAAVIGTLACWLYWTWPTDVVSAPQVGESVEEVIRRLGAPRDRLPGSSESEIVIWSVHRGGVYVEYDCNVRLGVIVRIEVYVR